MQICKYVILLFLFFPSIIFSQEKFDFYVSNRGNDSFPGTSNLFPKRSIADVAPLLKNYSGAGKAVKVGLKSGGVWKENLITSYPIEMKAYNESAGQEDFAILDGSKEFSTGWIEAPGTNNTFTQLIPYTGFVGYGIGAIGVYSFIYVFEIDKELEKTAPFTARKMLSFASGILDVENTRGSFYTPPGNPNPMPLFIHTSNGNSPNSNSKYRYEVCVKDWAVNSTYQDNNHFENLWVRGFGAGIGILPGGSNSYYNKIIFGPGAAVHHLVLRSGTIDHSLFLPAAKNTNGYAVVFYDDEGLNRHCSIKNSIFLDIRLPAFAHTSFGTNYGAIEMDNIFAFADTTEANTFMYTANTDSVLLNNIYADGYPSGYNYGTAKYVTIRNSYFKDVTYAIGYMPTNPVLAEVNNVFIKTKGTNNVTGIFIQENTSLTLTNSIMHLVSSSKVSNTSRAGSFVFGTGGTGKISAAGNIFICDVDPLKSLNVAVTNIDNGMGTSKDVWKNNVYILLKGDEITWGVTNNGSNSIIRSFDEWKRQSGQDRNSLFFDLRNDSRGLQAIFVDPANGNYELAETPEGKKIAALHAGMTSPLSCFLKKPTYEKAADLIKNNKTLSFTSCRNPCQQNTLRINNTFDLTPINSQQVKLQWNISEQQNIDRYELQRSSLFFGFRKIASFPVSVDSVYSYTDNIQPGLSYEYRLLVAAKAGNQCYADTRTFKITSDKPFTIYPNPSTGRIFVSMNGYIGDSNFSITNSTGQSIMATQSYSVYRGIELDFTSQPKGIYFLKLKTKNGISIQKFVLQ